MDTPLMVVVGICDHARRLVREPLCPACRLAPPAATFEACPHCVWINRGFPGAKRYSLCPGVWELCAACCGTGLGARLD